MQLASPSFKYKQSFLDATEEFQAEGRRGFWNIGGKLVPGNFEEYMHRQKDYAERKNLPEGWVPATTYWLIDNDEFIGHVNVRHELNDNLLLMGGHIGYAIRPSKRNMGYGRKILQLVLPKAKEILQGMNEALLTCDENNKPSRKIIEAAGGRLENIVTLKKTEPRKMRFWVPL